MAIHRFLFHEDPKSQIAFAVSCPCSQAQQIGVELEECAAAAPELRGDILNLTICWEVTETATAVLTLLILLDY